VSVPHGFRAAVALGAAALAMAPGSGRAQPIAVEETGTLPGRRATSIGAFAGVVGFSRDVEIGNSYYDDQVPGLGMLIGARAALALAAWGSSRLEARAVSTARRRRASPSRGPTPAAIARRAAPRCSAGGHTRSSRL
jgi:hypothetical protein